jgi:hypothetical protein
MVCDGLFSVELYDCSKEERFAEHLSESGTTVVCVEPTDDFFVYVQADFSDDVHYICSFELNGCDLGFALHGFSGSKEFVCGIPNKNGDVIHSMRIMATSSNRNCTESYKPSTLTINFYDVNETDYSVHSPSTPSFNILDMSTAQAGFVLSRGNGLFHLEEHQCFETFNPSRGNLLKSVSLSIRSGIVPLPLMQSTSVDIGPIDADVTMPSTIVTPEILSVQTLSHDGKVLRQTTIEMFDLTMDTIPLPSHVTVKVYDNVGFLLSTKKHEFFDLSCVTDTDYMSE